MIRGAVVAALLSSPAFGADVPCGAASAPEGAMEMREAVVKIDALGDAFPYLSILVPSAWSDSGAAEFDPAESCGAHEKLRWRATAPDGAASIEILPGAGWTASARPAEFSACKSRNLQDAASYAMSLLETAAPSAKVREVLDRPDLSAPINAQFASYNGYAGQTKASAVEVRFEAPAQGASVEHGAVVAVVMTFTPHISIPENETRATAFPVLLARARGASLDPGLVEAVRASALASPRWLAVREQWFSPTGMLPDPRKPISALLAAPDFAERETLPEATACGGRIKKLKAAVVWKGDDGRYWYVPARPAALEHAPENR